MVGRSVVRCFEDSDIIHVEGSVDPVRDIDIINIELALADMAQVRKGRREGKREGSPRQMVGTETDL